ncbi:jerky protein homolog-like [Procambarus clarkii]|uniref:jerky protein homolog-like n=1 Tax=Procambarus clarkii TaxID=6728 RepID=UPI0037423F23
MLPTETMAHSGEDDPSGGYKQNKQRISLLCCANAAGTHKLKLLVIGISKNPRALKSARCLPVIYKDQPSAWMSRVIFVEWFNKNFVPEVKEHLKSVGLPQNSKVVLLLDNSSTHPRGDELINGNIIGTFLPPNTTSVIQPMDQGIIKNLKHHYKRMFARRLNNQLGTLKDFYKVFTIKSAIWTIASAWDEVKQTTLRNGWKKLWPASSLFPEEDDEADFEGFAVKKVSEKKKLREELLAYVKGIKSPEIRAELVTETIEDDIDRWIDFDEAAPNNRNMTNDEIIELVCTAKKPDECSEEDGEEEEEEEDEETLKEKFDMEKVQQNFEYILGFMDTSYSEFETKDMMSLYNMYMKFLKTRAKGMKQMSITESFAMASKKARIASPAPDSSHVDPVNPTPSTSTTTSSM